MFEINKLRPIRNEAKSKGLDNTIILALKVKDVHKYLYIGYRFAVIFKDTYNSQMNFHDVFHRVRNNTFFFISPASNTQDNEAKQF